MVSPARRRGVHRKRRARAAWPGMQVHQDGSRHAWVAGQHWDLIVTMNDARKARRVVFGGMGSDRARGSVLFAVYGPGQPLLAYPEGRGKGGQGPLTQFGRAMRQRGLR